MSTDTARTTGETVTIAGRTFTVTRYADTGNVELVGARGAAYFLRGFLGEDTGRRAVVSWKSGAELRDRTGRAVRVVELGGVIEESASRPYSR